MMFSFSKKKLPLLLIWEFQGVLESSEFLRLLFKFLGDSEVDGFLLALADRVGVFSLLLAFSGEAVFRFIL